ARAAVPLSPARDGGPGRGQGGAGPDVRGPVRVRGEVRGGLVHPLHARHGRPGTGHAVDAEAGLQVPGVVTREARTCRAPSRPRPSERRGRPRRSVEVEQVVEEVPAASAAVIPVVLVAGVVVVPVVGAAVPAGGGRRTGRRGCGGTQGERP